MTSILGALGKKIYRVLKAFLFAFKNRKSVFIHVKNRICVSLGKSNGSYLNYLRIFVLSILRKDMWSSSEQFDDEL